MKIVDSLLNRSEEVVFRELQSIASDDNLKVFSKPRLSDVIQKGNYFLTRCEFDFYTRSHCDFVVTDEKFRPMMIVEYDGPLHADAKQHERDEIKIRMNFGGAPDLECCAFMTATSQSSIGV